MTELAFGALVIAALAWTCGNTGIARGASSLATVIFIVFLAIAVFLFALAVLGVSLTADTFPFPGGLLPETP